ncbi:MAG TPA: DNA ligase D, partial [Clostridia bacterium]|nr:DNA ligase D [Clostridia bacterium]
QTSDGVSRFDTSIRTGRSMEEIERGESEKITRNPFQRMDVQLARLVNTVPEGEDWLFELKYDGYRIIAYLEGDSVRLITRNGNDFTSRFQDVADALADWANGRAMILDGEMAITDAQGRTDFQALQSYMRNPGGKKLTYIVFDLLALDGADLRGRRLLERKDMLETLMKNAPKNLYCSKYIKGNGKESLLAACKLNLEGIVGKKADSVYSGTRNGDWVKLKCEKRQEFVIGGYTRSDKKSGGISSLLLGVYEGTELIYAGRAGTGLTERGMMELEKKFESIKAETAPFKNAPAPKTNESFTWLKPVMAAEIRFAEWTSDHLLRQASFKGLRTDKDPREIKMETACDAAEPEDITNGEKPSYENTERAMKTNGDSIIINGITVTSPDKVIFEDPEIRKADVVQYYANISERMMPYAGNRILSIVRCPKGVSQSCFFKKHPGPDSKGIVTLPVTTGSGETEDYFYIESPSGLITEAQMGTLEFHIW